jgi:hypothetical protein
VVTCASIRSTVLSWEIAGLVCARALHLPVHLTDLDSRLLHDNIELNSELKDMVVAQQLRWGDSVQSLTGLPAGPLLLLCADCLLPYDTGAMRLLAETIANALESEHGSLCLLAFEERCDVSHFFTALEQHCVSWRDVEDSNDPSLHMLALVR